MLPEMLYRWTGLRRTRLIRKGESPYLERYHLLSPGPRGEWTLSAYLHRFVRADGDEALHDHPWPWACSVVLCGGYYEERLRRIDPSDREPLAVETRWRRPGSISLIRRGDFHRIAEVRPETWTLFVHGAWAYRWGFLRHARSTRPDGRVSVLDLIYTREPPSTGGWWETASVACMTGREPMAPAERRAAA